MRSIILILILFVAGPGDDKAKKAGRDGNAQYEAGNYPEASGRYSEGLLAYTDEAATPVRTGLLNNLAAALYQQEDYESAATVFEQAKAMAQTPDGLARASYNAGNNAVRLEQLEQALDHYKNALLEDPTNEDAKFNYEFVKRQLDQQQEQNQDQDQQQNDQQQNQDQDQEQQDQENQQSENQDQQQEQNQDQQQQDQQNQQQEQNQEQQQQPRPDQLSEEQAERILQALENEEQQLLREVQKMKARPRKVEKDW